MKIINESKQVVCSYCKTKLEYEPKDIRTAFITNAPYILCPCCGNKIFII